MGIKAVERLIEEAFSAVAGVFGAQEELAAV